MNFVFLQDVVAEKKVEKQSSKTASKGLEVTNLWIALHKLKPIHTAVKKLSMLLASL